MWQNADQKAAMKYNASYHESLGCEPTTVFHSNTKLNTKLGFKPGWERNADEDLVDELQKQQKYSCLPRTT